MIIPGAIPTMIRDVRKFLLSLRLDGRTVRCCAAAAEIIRLPPAEDKLGWKKLLNRYGVDSVACAAAAYGVLTGDEEYEKQFVSVLKSGECFSMRRPACCCAVPAEKNPVPPPRPRPRFQGASGGGCCWIKQIKLRLF